MLNILVCTDNNYVVPLAALLNSLAETANNNKLTIHWFALEVSKLNIKKISALSGRLGYEIKVYNFRVSKISPRFFTSGRITSAAYLRLYLADQIKNVNKVLYLDCDMIVLGNIHDLWNYSFGEKVAAVVKDAAKINLSHLGKLTPRNYFNSGMMLINIDLWRSYKIQNKLFMLLNHKITKIFLTSPDENEQRVRSWITAVGCAFGSGTVGISESKFRRELEITTRIGAF